VDDVIVVAHRAVVVQFPSRPVRGRVGSHLGDQVQGVQTLVLPVPRLLSRAVLLLGRVSLLGTAASVPRRAGELHCKTQRSGAACRRHGCVPRPWSSGS